jgi:regulatory protein
MTSREGDGGGSGQARPPGLAPVAYLPGVAPVDETPPRWAIPLESATPDHDEADTDAPNAEEPDGPSAADAEDLLTRRVRRSALSEREARTFLLQRGIDPSVAEAAIERFTSRGWIDDAVLAEQLLYAGTSRKGQGRRAIAQTLSARGIAREVADAALAGLADDDDDRALEYARSKAHGLRSYDLETAMRRLMGQLARRGYSGSVASTAARTALTEQRSSGGVQFR